MSEEKKDMRIEDEQLDLVSGGTDNNEEDYREVKPFLDNSIQVRGSGGSTMFVFGR